MQKIKTIHQVLSLTGIVFLISFLALGYYEETTYTEGFNLHIFSRWPVFAFASVPFLYFVFNLLVHRSALKRQLYGAFFVVAAMVLSLSVFLLVFYISEHTRDHSVNLFGGLFKSENPPPAWLIFLRDTFFISAMLLVVVCFLLLTRLRKKWPV
jgi:hypothetical protein